MKATVEINNVSTNSNGKYIVARVFNGELWYWGRWDNKETAYEVAAEIGGVVCESDMGD